MASADLPKRRISGKYRVTPRLRTPVRPVEFYSAHPVCIKDRGYYPAPFPQPLYTVSIAVHDRVDLTKRCLDLVLEHSPRDELQIIVHDNASGPETEKFFDDNLYVEAERSSINLGFGAAHNSNLNFADGIYFVVLNNDVDVCHGWLEVMRERFLEDPEIAIVGPSSSACRLNELGMGSRSPLALADYVEGSCMMMPTWLARHFGLFDPEFKFAYCEDADLSLRARKRGWRIAFVENDVRHYRCGTSDLVRQRGSVDLDRYHRENHQILQRRWATYLRTKTFTRKILVRRSAAHGDVLLLTPVLRAMKQIDAHAEIHVETNVPEVLARNPYVSGIIRAHHGRGYDSVFDLNLAYERDPQKHIIQAYADAVGIEVRDWMMDIRPDKNDRLTEESKSRIKLAVIHPGMSTWPGRAWPYDNWSTVSRWLVDHGFSVAVVGDTSLAALDGETMNYRGTSVSRSVALIERAQLFVGVDSFPMHIAQASLVPTVGLFGCIRPELRLLPFPFIKGITAKGVPCLGCHHLRPGPLTHGKCHQQSILCMEQLRHEAVIEGIIEVLTAKKMFLETSKIRDRVLKYCDGKGIDIGCGRDKIREDALGFDDDVWPEVDVVGDASGKMPFPDGGWDYVYSSHALEDIADTPATLREWVRILRPGGHIVLQVPNPDHYKGVNLEHVHHGWRPQELSLLVKKSGCEIVEAFEDVGVDRYSTVVVGRRVVD